MACAIGMNSVVEIPQILYSIFLKLCYYAGRLLVTELDADEFAAVQAVATILAGSQKLDIKLGSGTFKKFHSRTILYSRPQSNQVLTYKTELISTTLVLSE